MRSGFEAASIFGRSLFIFLALVATSCTKTPTDPGAALVQRGRVIYQTNCIACHNPDPTRAGALGPELFGSSKELLEARIMRAAYPENYKPKRQTHQMVALPHLKGEIDALYSYLNSK